MTQASRAFAKRIIPAYAGSTLHHHEIISCSRDHPRIRGEHSRIKQEMPAEFASSPHTRGAQ